MAVVQVSPEATISSISSGTTILSVCFYISVAVTTVDHVIVVTYDTLKFSDRM